MDEIKIYLYSFSDERRNFYFIKNKKLFLKVFEEENEIYYIFYKEGKGTSEDMILNIINGIKPIDLYEFVFSNDLNEIILKPTKKTITTDQLSIDGLKELKKYFKNMIKK